MSPATSDTDTWQIHDSALLRVVASGDRRLVRVDEILARQSESPAAGHIPGLRVADVLVTASIVVEPGGGAGTGARWRVRAHPRISAGVGPADIDVAMVHGELADHVMHQATVLPLDLSAVRDNITNLGLALDGTLSLAQYLALHRLSLDDPHVAIEGDWDPAPLTRETPAIPGGLDATLYGYQESGYRWLCGFVDAGIGCILGDEMGLGKTLQIIALFMRERQESRWPNLVVAPASLLENWRRELARFAPSLAVLVHRGQQRKQVSLRELASHDVVVVSYETAVRDAQHLAGVGWNYIAMDEAQAIKNPDAQRRKVLARFEARGKIAVTGTPMENSLRDLWSISDVVAPGHLGSLRSFESRFPDHVASALELERHVSPLLLRRRVAEVAQDLPERIDIPTFIEMADAEATGYERLRQEIERKAALAGRAPGREMLTWLRQYCNHPRIVADHTPAAGIPSAKFDHLAQLLSEIFAQGDKVLVFSHWHRMTDLLLSHWQESGEANAGFLDAIDGRTSMDARMEIIDRFSGHDGAGMLVLNPKAAGTGLNITAATHVIHYAPDWNPAVEDQATARAWRRGQDQPVTVHRLMYVDTIDEVMDERLQHKRTLSEAAVVGTAPAGAQRSEAEYFAAALSATPKRNDT